MQTKKKKSTRRAMIIAVALFAAVIIAGGLYLFSKMGGISSDVQIINEEDLQDFIDEQEQNGIEVEIID